MVRPALDYALASLCAEAYNCGCYMQHRLPHSALNAITPWEALDHGKPHISQLGSCYTKSYAHIDDEKGQCCYKLEARSIASRLIGYMDAGKLFGIPFPLKHKANTVRQFEFEVSSNTSVDVHSTPLPSDLADNPRTIIQELRTETPPPTIHATTTSTQPTVPSTYPEGPVQARYPPLIEVLSPTTNMLDSLEVFGDERKSEGDSVTTNPIAGPSPARRDTSTSITSAQHSNKTARFD